MDISTSDKYLVFLLMMGGYAHIVDVCSAFLLGLFDNGEHLYAYVPKGWEHKFAGDVVLRLLKTVYGLKQAANCFYRLLVSVIYSMNYNKSFADPCLNHRWNEEKGLLIWATWCDDLLAMGRNEEAVKQEVEKVKKRLKWTMLVLSRTILGANWILIGKIVRVS